MNVKNLLRGGILGGISSLAVMALLFLGDRAAGLPFVPFDLFDWLARVLPGDLVTFGIDTIVSLVSLVDLGSTDEMAKLAEQMMALGLGLGGGILLGLIIAWLIGRDRQPGYLIGAISGLFLFVLIAAVELSFGLNTNIILALVWLALIFVGWGTLLGSSLGASLRHPTAAEYRPSEQRRVFLRTIGGSLLAALVAWGLGSLFRRQVESSGAGQSLADLQPTASPTSSSTTTATASPSTPPARATSVPATATPTPQPSPTATPPLQLPATATLQARIEPAPGTRPEITPTEEFYRIDINTRPPIINGDAWMLEVAGLFDNAGPLSLMDVMALPAATQPITLSCISNEVGGDLISSGYWTGVRLPLLLEELGLRPEAQELFIEAEDGFYESVSMADMMDPRTLLVYGMNGETLPNEHGFPLRIYIPNRYGMKQPKWITRIEAIAEEGAGYWVDRGWSEEARPRIISMIDTVATEAAEGGMIPVGGIAWAGDRGIAKVEVRVDDGQWAAADLRTPPHSPLTWVQWRYDWPGMAGEHTVTVRATDGNGDLQIAEAEDVRPDGATGYHSRTVSIPPTTIQPQE